MPNEREKIVEFLKNKIEERLNEIRKEKDNDEEDFTVFQGVREQGRDAELCYILFWFDYWAKEALEKIGGWKVKPKYHYFFKSSKLWWKLIRMLQK